MFQCHQKANLACWQMPNVYLCWHKSVWFPMTLVIYFLYVFSGETLLAIYQTTDSWGHQVRGKEGNKSKYGLHRLLQDKGVLMFRNNHLNCQNQRIQKCSNNINQCMSSVRHMNDLTKGCYFKNMLQVIVVGLVASTRNIMSINLFTTYW